MKPSTRRIVERAKQNRVYPKRGMARSFTANVLRGRKKALGKVAAKKLHQQF